MKHVCVYCGSSDAVAQKYVDEAIKLGEALAKRGATLVYGGGNVGLMGKVALAAQARGAKVIGVIPQRLVEREHVHRGCDELIITQTMRERKAIMDEKSDAFIALAGGFGTLDETMEAITIRQLGFHQKPIVFLNTDGFYDLLLAFFEKLYAEGFAGRRFAPLYQVANTVEEALDLALNEA
ncbi:MAG: TIGR00730 family Rossman fold protein [Chloroherpetonaceae bacterium]|nr:TIGR00730 family Rossman fold protein [Chloroherpetonaceae bacterium]MDW8437081.1 TIGR00730 family Rossman fold protein [Chloroherpetonaceae bacterium]